MLEQLIQEIITALQSLFSGLGSMNAPAQSQGPANAQSVLAVIQSRITGSLGCPDKAAYYLLAQSALETRTWQASSFVATQSLSNRHKGNGTVGVPNSDGYWTGQTYDAGPGDSDLRIYSSIDQSAQDWAQWLLEPSHASALAALRAGNLGDYTAALDDIGFSTDPSYGTNVARLYQNEYAGAV